MEVMELEIEEETLEPIIPNSWVDEQGIRHAVIWEAGLPERMRIKKENDKWVLIPEPPF